MILCVGTTPAVQRVMLLSQLNIDHINRARAVFEGSAGKAVNVAKVLRELGENPRLTGFLGGGRGEFIRRDMAERGVDTRFVPVASETRQCLTVVDEGTATHTELVEESKTVSISECQDFLRLVHEALDQCRVVVMSGTIAPGVPDTLYFDIIELARPKGILTVVDAQGRPLQKALASRPGMVKPNRVELASTLGRGLNSEQELLKAMDDILERGAERIVVTAGRAPTLAAQGGKRWRITNPEIDVRNPIGSGDAFTAGVVWRLTRGDDLGEACRWGAACGAANALTWMPGDLRHEDVKALAAKVQVEAL